MSLLFCGSGDLKQRNFKMLFEAAENAFSLLLLYGQSWKNNGAPWKKFDPGGSTHFELF